MGDQNPWIVENIEAFNFYCCPECDFQSKDRDYFKRHAMESHKRSKIFFIMPKSENTINKDPMAYKNEEDKDNLRTSELGENVKAKEL